MSSREKFNTYSCTALYTWPVSLSGTDSTRRYLVSVRIDNSLPPEDGPQELNYSRNVLVIRQGRSALAAYSHYASRERVMASGEREPCDSVVMRKDPKPRLTVEGITELR